MDFLPRRVEMKMMNIKSSGLPQTQSRRNAIKKGAL
jgi:hypothetical protein